MMMRKKTTKLPKMLVVRPFRETCLAFYSKFTKFDINYVTVNKENIKQDMGNLPNNFNLIFSKYEPTYWFDPIKLLFGKTNNFSWVNIKNLEEYIKKADVINITDTYYFLNRQVILLAKKYDKPVVVIIWKTIPNHITSWLFPYSKITKQVINSGNLFILRCKSAVSFAESIGIKKQKMHVSYKGVDLDHFYPKERKYSSLKPVRILYVGNLNKSKGILDLLWAFKKLINNGIKVELIIAGEGTLKKRIKKEIKDKKLPIKLLGHVDYLHLGNIYRQADIFCSPAREINILGLKLWEEYFSYTLMEAQACGLPIVTTRSRGVLEEVDSRNEIINPGNRKELYFSLKKLIDDSEARVSLGSINRKRAEDRFDATRQAKETEYLMLDMLKNTKNVN